MKKIDMETEIQIKTGEFEYINQKLPKMTAQEAVEAFQELKTAFEDPSGLSDDEFNEWLDRYVLERTGDADQYAKMNRVQKGIVQALKKSYKRIDYKELNK